MRLFFSEGQGLGSHKLTRSIRVPRSTFSLELGLNDNFFRMNKALKLPDIVREGTNIVVLPIAQADSLEEDAVLLLILREFKGFKR